jgi:hypothetical protein
MKGISKGETSTAQNPVLQLFCRQGEFLKDPVEGTFTIEDVRNPDVPPIQRVAPTTLNLLPIDAVPTPGHRLGPGRFYIPTGATTSWAYGTHRAVCKYKMVTGGREYQQVIEFEVLNPAIYPSGQSFVTYASSARLYADGIFTFSGIAPEKLHPHMRRVSFELENLLQRFFEPRYLDWRVDGDGRTVLFLDEAIVAMSEAGQVSKNPDGTETISPYGADGYVVYNRHLDGLLNPDDRDNPMLEVSSDQVAGYMIRGYVFPEGDKNLYARGVFGFLDPDPQSDGVLIGHTPDELVQVIGVLIARYIEDPTLSSPGTWQPGRIKMYQTRDQQIQFYGSSGNVDFTGGITGDAMLDQKLLRFVKPARLDYPERRGSITAI